MKRDIESQLRRALRIVEPRAEFSQKLLARMVAIDAAPQKRRRLKRIAARSLFWRLGASLAACLVLGAGIQQHLQQQRMRQTGLEARRQVEEALRVTSQKLNIAFEAINSQSAAAEEQSGL